MKRVNKCDVREEKIPIPMTIPIHEIRVETVFKSQTLSISSHIVKFGTTLKEDHHGRHIRGGSLSTRNVRQYKLV